MQTAECNSLPSFSSTCNRFGYIYVMQTAECKSIPSFSSLGVSCILYPVWGNKFGYIYVMQTAKCSRSIDEFCMKRWRQKLMKKTVVLILTCLGLNGRVTFLCLTINGCYSAGNCTVPGQYRDAGENVCRDCPRGQWQNQKWQTSCSSCNVGLTTRYTGTSNPADCLCKCVPPVLYSVQVYTPCTLCRYVHPVFCVCVYSLYSVWWCTPCTLFKCVLCVLCVSCYSLYSVSACTPCFVCKCVLPALCLFMYYLHSVKSCTPCTYSSVYTCILFKWVLSVLCESVSSVYSVCVYSLYCL